MWQAVTQLKGNFSPVLVQSNFHFFNSVFSMTLSASVKKRKHVHWILRKRSLCFYPALPFCKYYPTNYTVLWRIRWPAHFTRSCRKMRGDFAFGNWEWKERVEKLIKIDNVALPRGSSIVVWSDTSICKTSCVSPRITFTSDHLCCWITNNITTLCSHFYSLLPWADIFLPNRCISAWGVDMIKFEVILLFISSLQIMCSTVNQWCALYLSLPNPYLHASRSQGTWKAFNDQWSGKVFCLTSHIWS